MENQRKPLVSVIIPGFNEEAIIEDSLRIISDYLTTLEEKYRFEILLINDGSTDKTGEIADHLAKQINVLRVIHHPANMNLGRALQTGFKNAVGEIFVVLDIDLSYSVDHIGKLLEKQKETNADIVIASPYMSGGKVSNVPIIRALLSKGVNLFMRITAQSQFHTFTGMVRAYNACFIKSLNLKTIDFEINPEIIYKGIILRAKIVEIPAHLDWNFQNSAGKNRSSGMRIMRGFFSGLMSGFIFRPYFFYMALGLILLLVAMYMIAWIFYNTFQVMPQIQVEPHFIDDRFSMAVGQVFESRPHAFIVGGFTLLVSIQLISLGLMSLQNKRYFEELFHLNSKILRQKMDGERNGTDNK